MSSAKSSATRDDTPPERKGTRIAVDIGGTFTDVVLETSDGTRITHKGLTTYAHPGTAVLEGIHEVLERGGVTPADITLVIHGTTLATNALIERRGARTALITTEGHRDALEMAHEDRFEQYDINIDKPIPLVPRHLRLTVTERMNHQGNVLVPLDVAQLDRHLQTLDENNIESVAVGYLHAFVNPIHEEQTADYLVRHRPGLSVCLASQVAPEIREYERLSTACANAYVRPLMSRYLHRLGEELITLGITCPFLLMTSGGGLTTLATAARFPIRLVESGPAGGAILATRIAELMNIPQMLSFDMGGTTAKLCLIDDQKPLMSRAFEVDRTYRFKKGSGLPVRIPVIEMVEIGAGGGSIASIDKLNRIAVGPESAGSEPGPAAYGRGGKRPTVTDADVMLGKIYPPTFAFKLDAAAAQAAIESMTASRDDSTAFGAFSISEVVDENMSAAARAHAAEFGLDLGGRDIVAFGGAAPLHAARLGQKLGATRVIIPGDAGVGSAVGFLLAPVAYEVIRSRPQRLDDLDTTLVNRLFTEMQEEATAVVRQAAPTGPLTELRQVYMRYVGQGHELPVEISNNTLGETAADDLRQRFAAAYRSLYGQSIDGVEAEVLSWTLTVSEDARLAFGTSKPVAADTTKPLGSQQFYDGEADQIIEVPVYMRASIRPGDVINGPALITESQTTTVVTAAYSAVLDDYGNIILSMPEGVSDSASRRVNHD